MYLSEFQLYNYKSYQDSGPIEFKPGFNILTGQNNAGKTALLEGLGLRFQDKPHRSLTTLPTPAHALNEHSRARFRLILSLTEVLQFMSLHKTTWVIPYPKNPPRALSNSGTMPLFQLLQNEVIQVTLEKHPSSVIFATTSDPAFGCYERISSGPIQWLLIKTNKDNQPTCSFLHVQGDLHGNNIYKPLENAIGEHFLSGIYSFRAERMNVGISTFGPNRELVPDASNLPEVLNILQSNPARFQRYNQLVKRVLPQVERITVRPMGAKQVEILVWSYDPALEREDLAVPLTESGTGISQVLAMLYVLVTAESPRVLIIDEPNSFLHPGASRALIEIFREHPQHQYIVSTHSPDLISASNPSTIHILRKKEGSTAIEKADARESQHLRALLMEVGSRLSDVFGSDSILWVEGKTEEICFPLIVQKMLKCPLSGVSIVGVLHTGDFDSEDARSAFRLYEKLTQGQALLPPAIAFIFDRELRPEKAREDLVRLSQGKVSFLQRRTYENYLLHAGALSSVINGQPGFEDKQTTPAQIQTWIDTHASNADYYRKSKTRDFLQDIDAPRLLGDLFSELSGNTLEYNKVEHSLALTAWLLDHDTTPLQEIADLLANRLPTTTRSLAGTRPR